MTKKIIAALVTAVLAGAIIVTFAQQKTTRAPAEQTTPPRDQVKEKALSPPGQTAGNAEEEDKGQEAEIANPGASSGKYSGEEDIMAPDVAIEEIIFDGKVYQPAELKIQAGDVVIFRNKSSTSFWPASSPHPQHTDYPEFDPKKPIASGQIFEFKFTKPGTWKFHDHLNPQARGTVTVSP